MKNFQELYCSQHGIVEGQFDRKLFWLCLHRHAVLFAPILTFFQPDFFLPDRILIQSVGRLTRARDFYHEVDDFFSAPNSSTLLRRWLKIRLSTERLRVAFEQTMKCPDGPVAKKRNPFLFVK